MVATQPGKDPTLDGSSQLAQGLATALSIEVKPANESDVHGGPEDRGGKKNRGGDRERGPRNGPGTFTPDRDPEAERRAFLADSQRLAKEQGVKPPERKPNPNPKQRKDIEPRAGLEILNTGVESRKARLILDLGKMSIDLKILCAELLEHTKYKDMETSASGVEKLRVQDQLREVFNSADELQKMLTNRKERPDLDMLEENASTVVIQILEILRETDYLDPVVFKDLPKPNTLAWRKIEVAKNGLRRFVGDHEAITKLPNVLRPEFTGGAAHLVAKADTVEIEAVKTVGPVVKSPEEAAQAVIERNLRMFDRADAGENITLDTLLKEGYTEGEATDFLKLL